MLNIARRTQRSRDDHWKSRRDLVEQRDAGVGATPCDVLPRPAGIDTYGRAALVIVHTTSRGLRGRLKAFGFRGAGRSLSAESIRAALAREAKIENLACAYGWSA
jgi:hypothetical protein